LSVLGKDEVHWGVEWGVQKCFEVLSPSRIIQVARACVILKIILGIYCLAIDQPQNEGIYNRGTEFFNQIRSQSRIAFCALMQTPVVRVE
jgi:hypothetical protein